MKDYFNNWKRLINPLISLELGSECCNRRQTIFLCFTLQESVVPFYELVWLTTSQLSCCCS